jgi:hypothetical protein
VVREHRRTESRVQHRPDAGSYKRQRAILIH